MSNITFLQELSMAISCICRECGSHTEDLVRLVKKHDTEQTFIDAVNSLGVRQKWDLLNNLWSSSYNIFKPWFYKTLMDVIETTSEANNYVEQEINESAKDFYSFYQDAFEANKEVEQPVSQNQLEMWHDAALYEASEKLIELVEDGAIDLDTLEILPEYKEAVRKKFRKDI